MLTSLIPPEKYTTGWNHFRRYLWKEWTLKRYLLKHYLVHTVKSRVLTSLVCTWRLFQVAYEGDFWSFILCILTFWQKIWLIFDIQNWLWKHNFGNFWQTVITHRTFLKAFPWWHVDSWPKSLLLRTHHIWNSTTELILVLVLATLWYMNYYLLDKNTLSEKMWPHLQ